MQTTHPLYHIVTTSVRSSLPYHLFILQAPAVVPKRKQSLFTNPSSVVRSTFTYLIESWVESQPNLTWPLPIYCYIFTPCNTSFSYSISTHPFISYTLRINTLYPLTLYQHTFLFDVPSISHTLSSHPFISYTLRINTLYPLTPSF